MRRALLAALTLAACSSDPAPPPADAGDDAVVVDAGTDAPPADQGAPVDVGADSGELVDTGPLDAGGAVDVSPAADADASLPPGDDGSTLDAGHDAGAVDAGQFDTGVDTGPGDTGADAGPEDAGAVDAGRDVGVDVPRDVGVDAGPVTYDLEVERTGLEVHLLARWTQDGETGDCPPAIAAATCEVRGDSLSFSVRACYGVTFSGLADLRTTGPYALSFGAYFADLVQLQRGREGARRSFRVSFSASPPPEARRTSYRGIPGRTLDPARADLWLLGCSVM